jgi:hypothetical protein
VVPGREACRFKDRPNSASSSTEAAKALGIDVPTSLLLNADDYIE